MILYSIPYNIHKNIGEYYNYFMNNCVKNDSDYACFIDGDATFTTDHWGHDLEDIISQYPDCGLFSCVTNRVGSKYQRLFEPNSKEWKNNDFGWHRNKGIEVRYKNYNKIIDVSKDIDGAYLSGVMIMIRKKEWKRVGGFKENGMIGIDSDIHERFLKFNLKVHILTGVYLFHWYRGGEQLKKDHLLKPDIPLKHDEDLDESEELPIDIKTLKICVYTVVFGDYDDVKTPIIIDKNLNIDYVCFTDKKDLKDTVFKMRYINRTKNASRKAREIKIKGHKYLKGYDLLIWMDGSMRIIGSLKELIEPFVVCNYDIAMIKHWTRECLYDEAAVVRNAKMDKADLIDKQIAKYRAEKFPQKFGLSATGIFVRWTTINMNAVMDDWYDQIVNFSFRDQLSYDYIRWKHKLNQYFMEQDFIMHNIFLYSKHLKNRKIHE